MTNKTNNFLTLEEAKVKADDWHEYEEGVYYYKIGGKCTLIENEKVLIDNFDYVLWSRLGAYRYEKDGKWTLVEDNKITKLKYKTYHEIDNLINEHSDKLYSNEYNFQQPITLIEDDDTIILRNIVCVYRFLHPDGSLEGEEACIFTLANGKCVLIENRKIIKFPKDSTSSIDVYEADRIMWIDIGLYSYKNNNKWILVENDKILIKDACDMVSSGGVIRYLKNDAWYSIRFSNGKKKVIFESISTKHTRNAQRLSRMNTEAKEQKKIDRKDKIYYLLIVAALGLLSYFFTTA